MLEARLLGRFEVRLDGDPIDLASRPAQSLFAYLALNPNVPHRRERLAGQLWPDTSDANARNSLRHALWTLRRALGADGQYLLADDLTITLNADSDWRFDCAVLDQKPAVDWSADDLIGIVSEYGGDLLPGFYDEWVVLERQRLQVVFEHKMKLLLDRLVEARRWEDVLEWGERWIALGHVPEPAYRALMVAHAGLSDVSKMAATYHRCVESLKTELGVEPSEQTRTTYERLARGEAPPDRIAAPAAQPAIAQEDMPPAPGEPPFKGLQYFDEADADLFFGREQLTARLVSRLRESSFLAVVGASGSGKSSVARAGLVPALKRGAPLAYGTSPPEGSTRWRYHVITPTAHPLEALALSLTRDSDSVTTTATLIDDLARDSRSLHLFVRRRLETQGNSRNSGNSGVLSPTSGGDWAGNHLLLVVDQFEELFTLCRDEAERKAFIDNLLTATAPSPVGAVPTGEGRGGGEGPTIVVITLRADFYAHCADHAPLRDALAKHQEYIGRMSAEELRRTIEEPAKRGGWQFEPGLVDLLMRETGSEPGGLPLLSHALLETWQRRRGRTLTLRSYAESGGVHGAIAKTAESVYRRFTPEQQAIARSVFIRLTELGEGTQDTRRRAALDELTSRADDTPLVGSVLNILADARLITLAEETAEVAHEALIREWPTLRQWLTEDREGLRQHRHLTESAQEWEALGRDAGELYRGARLAQAVEWAETHVGELNALERAYLDASKDWAEREAAEREAQQQRELEAARTLAETQAQAAHRMRLRNRVITAVGVIALILAVLAGVFGAQSGQNAEEARRNLGVAEEQRGAAVAAQATAEAERQRAESEKRLAVSRELAIAAVNNLSVDPERSMLLAMHALSAADTREAREALHQAVQASRVQLTLNHDGEVWSIAYSPDGTRLATVSGEGTARVWDATTGKELLSISTPGVWWIRFSPDGTRLAVVSELDNTARLWDAATGKELLALSGHAEPVVDIAFSADGTRLATGSADKTAKLWDLATGQELLALSGHTDRVISVSFSPDGRRLVTGSSDATAKVWDLATGKELLTLAGHTLPVVALFSPDGRRIATASAEIAKVWDAATGQELLTLSHPGGYLAAAFSSLDSRSRFVTVNQSGTMKVWDTTTGEELLAIGAHARNVSDVAFHPDGVHVATASTDGTAKVWDISPQGSREWLTLAGLTGRLPPVAYSPDGTRIATSGPDNTAILWDASTGEDTVTLAGHMDTVLGLAFSPDGSRLATSSRDLTVRVWDAASGRELLKMSQPGHGDGIIGSTHRGIMAVAYSPDGNRLASAGADGTAIVWDAATGEAQLTVSNPLGFGSIAFSPDGMRLITGGGNPDADGNSVTRVWDITSGEELFTVALRNLAWGLAVSPDGTRLVTGGFGGFVKVWDAATGQELLSLVGHTGAVSGVAFSPNGTLVATAGADGTARLWDAATGEELLTLTGHTGLVPDVAFSPDGARLVTTSNDGTARVYLLRIEELIALAKSRLTRSLTVEECQQYLHVEACP